MAACYPSEDKARDVVGGGINEQLARAVEMLSLVEIIKSKPLDKMAMKDSTITYNLLPDNLKDAEKRFTNAALAAVRVGDSSFWKQVEYVRERAEKFVTKKWPERFKANHQEAAVNAFLLLEGWRKLPADSLILAGWTEKINPRVMPSTNPNRRKFKTTAKQVRDFLDEVDGIQQTTNQVHKLLKQSGCDVRNERYHSASK